MFGIGRVTSVKFTVAARIGIHNIVVENQQLFLLQAQGQVEPNPAVLADVKCLFHENKVKLKSSCIAL